MNRNILFWLLPALCGCAVMDVDDDVDYSDIISTYHMTCAEPIVLDIGCDERWLADLRLFHQGHYVDFSASSDGSTLLIAAPADRSLHHDLFQLSGTRNVSAPARQLTRSMKYFVAELEAAGIRLVDTKVVHRFFDLYAYVLEFDGDALTALGGRSARQAPRPSKQHQPVLIPVRVL